MKYLFLTILLAATIQRASIAQDIIVKNDKTEIKAKVMEILEDVIKYKKFEMLDGPVYSIKKVDVFMLIYQNGTKEYIEAPPAIPNTTAPTTDTTTLEPGIYFYNTQTNEYIEIEGANITNSKQGGFGETILRGAVSGLFSAKERVTISGSKANLTVTASPTFLFVIDATAKGFNNTTNYLGNVNSPNDFFLVQLNQKKDSREIVVGKSNNVSSSQGIDDKQKIAFQYKKIKKGVYTVTITNILVKGEYCFMFASASLYEGVSRKVFDFSVE